MTAPPAARTDLRPSRCVLATIATAGLWVLPALAGAGPLFTAPYMSFGAGGRPFAVATADMNRDGFPDLGG